MTHWRMDLSVSRYEGEEHMLIRATFVHWRLEPAEQGHAFRIESA
jgi:hypothetical protein